MSVYVCVFLYVCVLYVCVCLCVHVRVYLTEKNNTAMHWFTPSNTLLWRHDLLSAHVSLTRGSDMEYLEVLTEGIDRVLMVRGSGKEVVTIFS